VGNPAFEGDEMKNLLLILLTAMHCFGASTWTVHQSGAQNKQYIFWNGAYSTTVGETTYALDSAFTFGSAGDCISVSFRAQETGNLTDIWIKVKQYNGTWASTDGVINVQVREGFSASNIPGTLISSTTITLDGSTTGWIKKSGLSIALTAGKIYSIVVGDADGGAANFVTLVSDYDSSFSSSGHTFQNNGHFTSVNGFSSAGTIVGAPITMHWKQAGILYAGSGFDTIASIASSTIERGLRFRVPEKCTLVGVTASLEDHTYFRNSSAIKLYADGTAPGGTTLLTVTTPTVTGSTPNMPTYFFESASRYDLQPNTWYRLVVAPAASTTLPRKATITGNPDDDIRAALLPFGTSSHWIEESGGTWDDTQTNSIPFFGPILAPNTDSSGGGSFTFIQ
jgi:hypothetical protein